jgi:hypothetical protein
MTNLSIVDKRQPIDKDGLELLKDFLEMVAAKEVTGYAIAYTTRDGEVGSISACAEGSYTQAQLAHAMGFSAIRVLS